MRVNQLHEGTIDIPPYIIKKAQRELLKFISTSAIAVSDSPDVLKNAPIDIYSKFSLTFSNYGEAYDLSDGSTLGAPITFHHEHVKYAQKRQLTGKETIIIAGSIDGNRSNTLGLYIQAKNGDHIVAVNLYKLFKTMESELNMAMWAEGIDPDNPEDMDMLQSTYSYTFTEINDEISKFIDLAQTTLEHEIAHAFQVIYFGNRLSGAEKGSNDYSNYLTSDIEFDPTISGIVKHFELLKNKGFFDNNQEFGILLFKRLVDLPYDQEAYHQSMMALDNVDDIFAILRDKPFFEELKKHRNDKWKKAVKYVYTSIKSLDIV